MLAEALYAWESETATMTQWGQGLADFTWIICEAGKEPKLQPLARQSHVLLPWRSETLTCTPGKLLL